MLAPAPLPAPCTLPQPCSPAPHPCPAPFSTGLKLTTLSQAAGDEVRAMLPMHTFNTLERWRWFAEEWLSCITSNLAANSPGQQSSCPAHRQAVRSPRWERAAALNKVIIEQLKKFPLTGILKAAEDHNVLLRDKEKCFPNMTAAAEPHCGQDCCADLPEQTPPVVLTHAPAACLS